MAIKLATKCDRCIHADVCRNNGQAELLAKYIQNMKYSDNIEHFDDTVNGVSEEKHIQITISCMDYHYDGPLGNLR